MTKTPSETPAFDPGRHLRKVNGSEYLEVKWRLVWLRTLHPDAEIDTELIGHQDHLAIFRARISIPDRGSATGWGSEEKAHFQDYIEKAETKAIGRALGALGFGTQFADDFADAPSGRIADAPVTRQTARPTPVPHDQINGQALRDGIVNESKTAQAERNDKRDYTPIFVAGTKKGLKPEDVKALAYRKFNVTSMTALSGPQLFEFNAYLDMTDAETLIDTLAEIAGV